MTKDNLAYATVGGIVMTKLQWEKTAQGRVARLKEIREHNRTVNTRQVRRARERLARKNREI